MNWKMSRYNIQYHPPRRKFQHRDFAKMLGLGKTSNQNRSMDAAIFLGHLLSKATAAKAKPPSSAIVLTPKILNHLRGGRVGKAVQLLGESPDPFDFSLYTALFQECASAGAIYETRKVESQLAGSVPNPPTFLLNRAIEAYGKCGFWNEARKLFDEMPRRDGGSWNAVLSAYSQNACPWQTLELFHSMHKSGVWPSEVTFSSVLSSCGSVLALRLAVQVHGMIVRYGFVGNVNLQSSLVDVYGKCGEIAEAGRMFEEIENPNAVSWNIIVRRYLDVGMGEQSVMMFSRMIRMKVNPLSFTVSNALVACSGMKGVTEGVQIHGYAVKINLEQDEIVTSSLIDMYVKCRDMASAWRIFDLPSSKNMINYTSMLMGCAMSGKIREGRELFFKMTERSTVAWNAMLTGYISLSQWDKALELILLMLKQAQSMDHVTLGLILKVCSGLSDLELGKQVHGYMYRHAMYSNLFVGNALLNMYGKCGNLKLAKVWFSEMVHVRDAVSWTCLLTSYAQHKMSEQSMSMFDNMLGEAIPSNFTMATLLSACANTFALEHGKQIHGFMIRNHFEVCTVTSGALVDMYSKCRCLDYALRVFSMRESSDAILWNSMILGCVYNGKGKQIPGLFRSMEKEGINPDHVTFHGLLLACVSEGWIELGRQYFDSMSDNHFIIPRLEHYQCMIELYGQHRYMEQLEEFILTIPFKLTSKMLIRVIDLCRDNRHLRLEEWAADQLNTLNREGDFDLDKENA